MNQKRSKVSGRSTSFWFELPDRIACTLYIVQFELTEEPPTSTHFLFAYFSERERERPNKYRTKAEKLLKAGDQVLKLLKGKLTGNATFE